MPKEGIYLAFDFGMKRIGAAVGQTITCSANPLPYLDAKEGEPQWEEILKLIKTWRPQALVVGVPLNMDNTEQEITRHARQFAKILQEKSHLSVYEIDERLTTVEARSRMFAGGGFKALKKGEIDSMAAKIMLESWLSSE